MFLLAHGLTGFNFVKGAPEVFEMSGMTFEWPVDTNQVDGQVKSRFFLYQAEEMNLQIIHHFFLISKWFYKNTWNSNAELNQNFLTYLLKQAKIRSPQSLYFTGTQEILITKRKNEEPYKNNQIAPPFNDVTVSSNALLNAIAADPNNMPVNNKEQNWKPSPVGTQLMESTLKSSSEKNYLLGQYIFTDGPLIRNTASRASSIKSDPPGSTSYKVKKESV